MRLQPIERPRGLTARLAHRASRKRFGRVLTPLKTVYARVPSALRLSWNMSRFVEDGVHLDLELRLLIQSLTARLNGCGFCIDIGEAVARRAGVAERLAAVEDFETDPSFTPAERAALRYVRAVTRRERVDDATFAELRRHFDERGIVEITLLNAVENFWNLVNVPLEIESDGLCALVPDRPSSARRSA
jgi:AhpD family alkylhydroperoxidase